MSLKRITTPEGDVYFIDSVSGQRVKTKMDVIKTAADSNTVPLVGTVSEKILNPDEEQIETLKKTKKWFAIAQNNNGEKIVYQVETFRDEMEKNILEGIHSANNQVDIYTKNDKGEWTKVSSTITQFSRSHFKLGVLYRPVWSHAVSGLKWGALIGVVIKLFDTFLLLLKVEEGMAFLFLIAIGVCFIPRVGIGLMVVISLILSRLSKVNFFFMALAGALIGAIIGCLPGMAAGGIIGLVRRDNLPKAKDAEPEENHIVIKSVILPLIFGLLIIWFYIFVFNPWLIEALS
ncbi:MAG: hypothetical protein FIA82_04975 [Melioribacter sp.]|nr:hypothetical protein [Melioribacter sp.]